MNIEKKQAPQLALLGILVILCIGYVSFQVASPKKQKPRPAAVKTSKATPAKTANVAVAQDAAEVVLAPIPNVYPNLATTPARRDPFVPAGLPGAFRDSRPAASTRPVTTAARLSGSSSPFSAKAPFNPFRNLGTGSGPSLAPVGGTANTGPVDPEFRLTGVVRGSGENVAIIRTGDNSRYVVKQGQLIEGRYRVLSISDSGAVLACGSRRIHVRLGGDKNAS